MLSKSKLTKSSKSTAERHIEKYQEVMTKEFAPATTSQQQIAAQPALAGQDDKLDVISTMMELPSDRVRPAAWAAAKLYADAKERFDDPQVFTMTMHIKVDGKVELIPVPQKENITKMKEHFSKLPKRLQRTLRDSMQKDHLEAFEELCDYLDVCKAVSAAAEKKRLKSENAAG